MKVLKSKKEYVPKIVVVADDTKIKACADEFHDALGLKCLGIKICSLEEAFEQNLPLRKSLNDYANNKPHDVYVTPEAEEKIPEGYFDGTEEIDIDKVIFKSDLIDVEVEIGVQTQERNEPCACGSGKKYKKCCIKKNQTLQKI